jgi:hypothetical protein
MRNLTTNKYNRCFVTVALLALCLCVANPLTWSQESSESAKTADSDVFWGSMKVSGTLNSTFRYESFDDWDDSDIHEYLSLQFKDIIKDRVDAAFSMMWHEDLNGIDANPAWGDPFLDLDYTSNNRVKYYTGYADIKRLGFEESYLRLGRQYLSEIDHAHFDGATYQFSPSSEWDITLFGGRPVTYYSSTTGDAIFGTNIAYAFSQKLKTAVRYYRYDTEQFCDDLFAAELWWKLTPNVMTHHEVSILDDSPYLWQSDLYARIDSVDVDVNVQIIRMFETIGDHTINFNPAFAFLSGYEPYTYGSIFTTKGLGKYVSLVGGLDVRETDTTTNPVSRDVNRDYFRITAGAEFYPTEQLTLSVNGEFWDVDPQSEEFTGITGEIEYKPSKNWSLAAGVDYGEYMQEFVDELFFNTPAVQVFRISPDVVTYYGRVRWRPTDRIYTAARFEVEDSDYASDHWYSFRLELGVNF